MLKAGNPVRFTKGKTGFRHGLLLNVTKFKMTILYVSEGGKQAKCWVNIDEVVDGDWEIEIPCVKVGRSKTAREER